MRYEVRYVMMDPTGNMTVLVQTEAEPCHYAQIASRLMELEPDAEQVGFLSSSCTCDLAMRMAGGEFCGNGAMSAAVLYGIEKEMQEGRFLIDFWGVEDPVCVTALRDPDMTWKATVRMPDARGIEYPVLTENMHFPVVRFDGICHVILPWDALLPEDAERFARIWCNELDTEAVGLMFLDPESSRLRPLVWVPDAGTMCWENACGSGSCAVGAYMAETQGIRSLSLVQPGGTLTVNMPQTGGIYLGGSVRYCYRKTVVLDLPD